MKQNHSQNGLTKFSVDLLHLVHLKSVM